jgi:dihydrofolate synthase/folylpolyglutamate synthase
MNYKETLDFLFAQLPMFQRVGNAAYKANLDNTIALMKALGNPENKFKSIHIAGTNGKGSTAHMIASVLQEAGYKTGLYTSPHLIDFRERIKINGKPIPKKNVIQFVISSKEMMHNIKPSFFELTVGMAFDYFAREKVDIAVVEVGLGGRLDSTNVIIPEVSVITNIGFDHTQFLGNDLKSIAIEKAGIIKENTPVVVGAVKSEVEKVFLDKANESKASILFIKDFSAPDLEIDLKGNYQKENLSTAVLALKTLRKKGWKIPESAIKKGLTKIAKNTGLHGRWEILGTQPKIICDTAHNTDGIKWISGQLQEETYGKLHMVIGMVNDKNPESILKLLPENAQYYLCESSIPRKLQLKELLSAAKTLGMNISGGFKSVEDAFNFALKNAKKDDLIFVGGSTFIVADLLELILPHN